MNELILAIYKSLKCNKAISYTHNKAITCNWSESDFYLAYKAANILYKDYLNNNP